MRIAKYIKIVFLFVLYSFVSNGQDKTIDSLKRILQTQKEDTNKVNTLDIGRVILNLINNAFYAVDEKKKRNQNGYEPTVSVSTKKNNGKVEIRVVDNGNGIPQKILDNVTFNLEQNNFK